MKVVVRRKLIALSTLVKKLEISYTSNSTAENSRTKKNTSKRSRRHKIVKLRAEINQIETKRTIQRISNTKSWFFERINKIDIPLVKQTEGHRGSIQINKFRDEKGDITRKTEEIQKILRSYYKSLYSTGKSG